MAKFLLESGFELIDKTEPDKVMRLTDISKRGNYNIRVSWDDESKEMA